MPPWRRVRWAQWLVNQPAMVAPLDQNGERGERGENDQIQHDGPGRTEAGAVFDSCYMKRAIRSAS